MDATNLRKRKLIDGGVNPDDCTSEEWLKLALESEQTKRDCGPHDPAFRVFAVYEKVYLEAAAIAESEGR
jgi:hypothetical protein